MSKQDTMHRVVVFWDEGEVKDKYFMNSLGPEFHDDLQEMVAELGPPTRVEFRATDKGWYKNESSTEVVRVPASTAEWVRVCDPETYERWNEWGGPLEDCKPVGVLDEQ